MPPRSQRLRNADERALEIQSNQDTPYDGRNKIDEGDYFVHGLEGGNMERMVGSGATPSMGLSQMRGGAAKVYLNQWEQESHILPRLVNLINTMTADKGLDRRDWYSEAVGNAGEEFRKYVGREAMDLMADLPKKAYAITKGSFMRPSSLKVKESAPLVKPILKLLNAGLKQARKDLKGKVKSMDGTYEPVAKPKKTKAKKEGAGATPSMGLSMARGGAKKSEAVTDELLAQLLAKVRADKTDKVSAKAYLSALKKKDKADKIQKVIDAAKEAREVYLAIQTETKGFYTGKYTPQQNKKLNDAHNKLRGTNFDFVNGKAGTEKQWDALVDKNYPEYNGKTGAGATPSMGLSMARGGSSIKEMMSGLIHQTRERDEGDIFDSSAPASSAVGKRRKAPSPVKEEEVKLKQAPALKRTKHGNGIVTRNTAVRRAVALNRADERAMNHEMMEMNPLSGRGRRGCGLEESRAKLAFKRKNEERFDQWQEKTLDLWNDAYGEWEKGSMRGDMPTIKDIEKANPFIPLVYSSTSKPPFRPTDPTRVSMGKSGLKKKEGEGMRHSDSESSSSDEECASPSRKRSSGMYGSGKNDILREINELFRGEKVYTELSKQTIRELEKLDAYKRSKKQGWTTLAFAWKNAGSKDSERNARLREWLFNNQYIKTNLEAQLEDSKLNANADEFIYPTKKEEWENAEGKEFVSEPMGYVELDNLGDDREFAESIVRMGTGSGRSRRGGTMNEWQDAKLRQPPMSEGEIMGRKVAQHIMEHRGGRYARQFGAGYYGKQAPIPTTPTPKTLGDKIKNEFVNPQSKLRGEILPKAETFSEYAEIPLNLIGTIASEGAYPTLGTNIRQGATALNRASQGVGKIQNLVDSKPQFDVKGVSDVLQTIKDVGSDVTAVRNVRTLPAPQYIKNRQIPKPPRFNRRGQIVNERGQVLLGNGKGKKKILPGRTLVLEGGKKRRSPAKPGDGRKKRAEIVRRVMADKGMKMIEASKYVKEHGLY